VTDDSVMDFELNEVSGNPSVSAFHACAHCETDSARASIGFVLSYVMVKRS
jgi:hypothetical protein